MMKASHGLLAAALALGGWSALAQAPADANTGRPTTDDDIAVLRQDIQADKTAIISRNMQFSDAQSSAFWPVYSSYAHDQQTVADQRAAIIKDYASQWDTMDDAQAQALLSRSMKYDDDLLKLRKKYVPKFEKAIGPKQTAKFFQVDNRLSLLVSVQLAAMLPVIK